MLLTLDHHMQPLYSYLHGSNNQSRSLPSSAPLAVRITPNESFSGAANSTWSITQNYTLAMYLANETLVSLKHLSGLPAQCVAARDLHHTTCMSAISRPLAMRKPFRHSVTQPTTTKL